MANDEHEALYALAHAAGLTTQWHDHRGRAQTVQPDVIKAVLDSLELPAGNAEQCRESLENIKVAEQQRIPSLITGRCRLPLVLPPALQATLSPGDTVQLIPQDEGEPQYITLQTAEGGETCLVADVEPGYYTLEVGSVRANLAMAPQHCRTLKEVTGHDKSFGLAAQIYSLRSEGDGGIGNFTGLKQIAEQSAKAGAQALAISPVHALFSADKTRYSPYAPSSRLFLNALYIDPKTCLGAELVQACLARNNMGSDLEQLEQLELIDWPKAAELKLKLLRCLWDEQGNRLMAGEGQLGKAYHTFCETGGQALHLHAVFEALHAHHFGNSPDRWHWQTWPKQFQNPADPAVERFAEEHKEEVGFHAFLQWLAAEGLADAHRAGVNAGLGVGLIADLAIGTDSGGSHSWSRQREMLTGLSVGAPPDYMNYQGQNWGLTSFSPRALMAHDFEPFLEMLRAQLRYAGGLRIDHVLGLQRLWVIPEGAKATEGCYLRFPQQDLFNLIALESHRHNAVIIGEDLGTVSEGFRDEISDVGILGMQVLWFERSNGLFTDPSRWRSSAIATTTTHDVHTVAGWWQGKDIEWSDRLGLFEEGRGREDAMQERARDRDALWAAFVHAGVSHGEPPSVEDPTPAIDSAVAYVASAPSPLTLVPLEDILGVNEQPNLPGTIDEHPNWQRRLPLDAKSLLKAPQAQRRLDILNRRSS